MKIIVCDDDKKHLDESIKSLKHICGKHGINADIKAAVSNDVLQRGLKVFKADLLFLDINLQDADGMQAAGELRAGGFGGDIVFYSRHEERMREAFDVSALNFLVKDTVDEVELERVFLRAVDSYSRHNEKVILFSNASETRRIPVLDISYFEVNNRITTVHYGADESFDFYSPLAKIEARLKGKDFVRCHRSYLVCIKHITKLVKNAAGYLELVMDDGGSVPVGNKYKEELTMIINSRQ